MTQRQDALGENRHLPWGLLGAPLPDLQASEPKVSNVLSTLRNVLWANHGKTQALPDQTHCLHQQPQVHAPVTLMPRVQAWSLGPGQEGLSVAPKTPPLGSPGLTLHCPVEGSQLQSLGGTAVLAPAQVPTVISLLWPWEVPSLIMHPWQASEEYVCSCM